MTGDHDETRARLDEALDALASILDRGAVMRRVVEIVAHGLDFDGVWIAEPRNASSLAINYQFQLPSGQLNGLIVPQGLGLTGKVFDRKEVEVVNDYFHSRRITHDFDEQVAAEGIKRMIAAPLVIDGRLVGVLTGVRRDAGSFSSHAVTSLRGAARRAAVAVDAAERARRFTEMAIADERRDIAHTMHDSIGALLFAIQANVRDLSQSLEAGSDAALRASSIERNAAQAAAALRESLSVLSAPPERLVLGVKLRADCRAFEQRTGVSTSFLLLNVDYPEVDQTRVSALVDAAREGLLNIEKHAKASSVAVTLAHRQGQLVVTLIDDGVGMPEEVEPGLGLVGMNERLARLGGGVTFSDGEDRGGILRAWIAC